MHVARGRTSDAVACFRRAAEDPEEGAEALSLLAAAYLLPGTHEPELALLHAYRAASHPAAGRDHLARCAVVALWAGDAAFAEALARRLTSSDGDEAAAIRATVMLRRGDRSGLRRFLARLRCASGPAVFWQRLALELADRRWLREALAARRAMRRGGLPGPSAGFLVMRALPPAGLFAALLGGILAALSLPHLAPALAALAGVLGLSGMAVSRDLQEGRWGAAAAGAAWMLASAAAFLLLR